MTLRYLRHSGCPFFLAAAFLAFSYSAFAQIPTDSGQASAPPATSPQVVELQKVVDRWDDAIGQHDQYGLELVLAPQFVSIADTGDVRNRDEVVSDMVRKDAPRYTLAQKVITVRLVGDVAVVNGTYDRSYPGGHLTRTKAREQKGVFSQVYVRARNSWECINSQRTLIAESTVKSNKKKTRYADQEKPLHHDLGFHLPGMHQSNDSNSQPQTPQ